MAESFQDEELLEWLGLATRQGPTSAMGIADAKGWDRGEVDAALRRLEVEDPARVRRWPKAITAMVNPDADDDDLVDGWTLAEWALPPELGGKGGPRPGETGEGAGPLDRRCGAVEPNQSAANAAICDLPPGHDGPHAGEAYGPAAAERPGRHQWQIVGPDVADDETHANSRLADALDFESEDNVPPPPPPGPEDPPRPPAHRPVASESDPELLARLGTDAQAWAREYVARFGGDEGLMISWFANAIEAGRAWQPNVEAIWTLVFEAAGAATAPFMRAHPHFVMPSEEVADGVREVMASHGFTHPPVGYRKQTPEIDELLAKPQPRERAITPDEHEAALTVDAEEDGILGQFALDEGPVHAAVATYLDEAIRLWRRRAAGDDPVPEGLIGISDELHSDDPCAPQRLAGLYVDAFQSVRSSLLGAPLPQEGGR